jgi:hypothetical protein
MSNFRSSSANAKNVRGRTGENFANQMMVNFEVRLSWSSPDGYILKVKVPAPGGDLHHPAMAGIRPQAARFSGLARTGLGCEKFQAAGGKAIIFG